MAHGENFNHTSDVVTSLYEAAEGLRFICDTLEGEPCTHLCLLKLIEGRVQQCAERIDALLPPSESSTISTRMTTSRDCA